MQSIKVEILHRLRSILEPEGHGFELSPIRPAISEIICRKKPQANHVSICCVTFVEKPRDWGSPVPFT